MTGLLVCDDLIFASKVTATARAHGQTVRVVTSALAALQVDQPVAAIVDLHTADLQIESFVAAIGCPVIGFGSHVDVDRLKAARAAGCAKVMPRSQFVAELETRLTDWLAGPA
jgi:ActR/RegA family two-component response regulator